MSVARRLCAIVDFDTRGQALGNFERGGMRVDYVETVSRYLAAEGADELWLRLAEPGERGAAGLFDPLRALAADLFMPLVAWGGVRTASDARLVCGMGADRVVISCSSPKLTAPVQAVHQITQAVGADRVSAAVVVRRVAEGKSFTWEVCELDGTGTGVDAIGFFDELRQAGAGELVIIPSHEGELTSHPTGLVERVAASMEIQLVSIGAEKDPADVAAPLMMGADAVATASLFRDGSTTVAEVKGMLQSMGIAIRPASKTYAVGR
jgi:imidazole glycerol phosphate synthase subunit HisF